MEASDRLLENFDQSEGGSWDQHSAQNGSYPCKGIKCCAKNWCHKLCTFSFEATCAFGKMIGFLKSDLSLL